MPPEPRNLATAQAAWGAALPDWVRALAEACDAGSQSAVARQIGLSGAAVNQVLRNRYSAGTGRIEQRVRGTLMAETLDCPELGALAADLCLEWQGKARSWSDSSSLRTRMRRACLACPHYRP